ncbi:hypothetical protein [Streptomyces sp. Iso 434]|uniref:hypothetical protein n=1 Tax=Streptomyces sp. Iso 434 TaxID=3062272 RepID=UPI0039812F14
MHEDPAGSEAARWYRGRLVTGPFAPFDLAGLALLEAGTGLPLPAAYRAFLEVGGGRLEYAVHLPAWAPEPLQSFNRLYRPGRDEHGEHGWGTLWASTAGARSSGTRCSVTRACCRWPATTAVTPC